MKKAFVLSSLLVQDQNVKVNMLKIMNAAPNIKPIQQRQYDWALSSYMGSLYHSLQLKGYIRLACQHYALKQICVNGVLQCGFDDFIERPQSSVQIYNTDQKISITYFPFVIQQIAQPIIITILLSIMNFLITGKKMRTTSLYASTPKKQQAIVPFMIQSKPITQKTYQQPKKKPTFHVVNKSLHKKRQQTPKIQVKKQVLKKSQGKVSKPRIEEPKEYFLTNKSEAVTEAQSKIEDTVSQVIIRYNHYKHPFVSIKGILSFAPIQQKYSFSDVFRGNFQPRLKNYETNEYIIAETKGKAVEYSWKVQQNAQYRLQIEQDQQQESKHQKKIYKAPQNQGCPFQKKLIIQELTEELKRLQPSEYGGEKHRQILQQRDLQELLFS